MNGNTCLQLENVEVDERMFSAENKNSHFLAQKFLAGKQKRKHYSSVNWSRKRRQIFSWCKIAKKFSTMHEVQQRGWRKGLQWKRCFSLNSSFYELWVCVCVAIYMCASVVFALIYGPADRQSAAIAWHTSFMREIIPLFSFSHFGCL